MTPSVSSVSSLGDETENHDETPRVSNVRPSSREHAQDHLGPGMGDNPQETASSLRLLRNDHQKTYAQDVFEIGDGVYTYDTSRQHQRSKRKNSSWYHDWWVWEIAAVVLSLGSTTAIIAILAKYNGKPLPNWPYKITLNSMLSVLSTISKVLFPIIAVSQYFHSN